MEVKKSPQVNLEKGISLRILMGLIVALSIVFVSFEWGTHSKVESLAMYEIPEIEFPEDIEITRPDDPTPPPPPPVQITIEELIVVDDDTFIEDAPDFTSEDNINNAQPDISPGIIDSQEEEDDNGIPFVVVEDMPVFPGGDGELMRFINRSVKYPVIAIEQNIQGRVVCSFVINTDGTVSEAEVVRGIDPALDKEALRVIGLMPAWEPGKQRGKPVRVKYTLPIQFRLNQ